MIQGDGTLLERARRMYRQLSLLQRLLQSHAGSREAGDPSRDVAVRAAVLEIVDELTDHAEVLSEVPFPISEWREGDESDDERWRALTAMERRQLHALLDEYETLVTWSEQFARWASDLDPVAQRGGPAGVPELADATDYLAAEKSKLERVRQELGLLTAKWPAPGGSTATRAVEWPPR